MEVELQPGEELITSRRANRTQSALRAVGGKLHLTNERLVFLPHGFDKGVAGKDWTAALSSIREVDEAPVRLGHFFGGGLRKRLRVTLADGGEELFVVSKLGEVVEEVREAAARKAAVSQPPD